MKRQWCLVYVSPEIIAEWLKHGSDRTFVVRDAVPMDAVLIGKGYSLERDAFWLRFKHASFPEGEHIREPMFTRPHEA